MTPRNLQFITFHIIEGLPPAEAYMKAGFNCTKASALVLSSRKLNKVEFQDKIKELGQKVDDKMVAELLELRKDVIAEYKKLAFVDAKELFSEDGQLKEIHELPPGMSSCIAGIDIEVKNKTTKVKKIKFWNKNTALKELSELSGAVNLITTENIQKETNDFTQINVQVINQKNDDKTPKITDIKDYCKMVSADDSGGNGNGRNGNDKV